MFILDIHIYLFSFIYFSKIPINFLREMICEKMLKIFHMNHNFQHFSFPPAPQV